MPASVHVQPLGATVRATLGALRFGHDPTTILDGECFWRATHTPAGPGTICLRVAASGDVDAHAWGPGSDWLCERVDEMTGRLDQPPTLVARHAAVADAQRRHRDLRIGASRTLYHELLVTVLGQRITAGEAAAQWRRVCRWMGGPAPGPNPALSLPPEPTTIRRTPSWRFHRLGIERRRAETLHGVAAVADRLWDWAWRDPAECAHRLAGIPGVGQWTIGTVLGTALGDPDAVAVGDFHLRNTVAYALTGRPRGSDEEMLEHLQPYAGQRGRVVALLAADGWQAPKFGPRQPIVPIASL